MAANATIGEEPVISIISLIDQGDESNCGRQRRRTPAHDHWDHDLRGWFMDESRDLLR